MDPQTITELANLLRNNGDKILNSEFTLTLSGSLLRALNDSFTLITDSVDIGSSQNFQVAKAINSKSPVFSDLQLIYDFVQKTTLLRIIHYPTDDYFEGTIDISKFRALRRLEVQKTQVRQIVGIQPLRSQLQQLICVKSLRNVEEVITRCGGDNSNGFVWNELKIADFSFNNLQQVDTALEFAQFLQHLNLRHNQLRSVEAIKWLPHLKTLDLSFNCLQVIPQFHMEAYKRLQSLNMSNNFVENLMGVAKLDALTDMDLSDNCLLDHSCLLPLSALITLKYLNLYGNPLHCHPKHRLATSQYLHKNTATVKFILDFEPLSKNEKALTGTHQMRRVGALNRYATRSSAVSLSSNRTTPTTQTPASSVGSLRSFKLEPETTTEIAQAMDKSNMKRHSSKVRTVEIEEASKTPDEEKDSELLRAKENSTELARVKLEKTVVESTNSEHLEAKKHIEDLREKFGANWLQSGNAEMIQSVLGIENPAEEEEASAQMNSSRQLFNDYLGELSETAMSAADSKLQQQMATNLHSSTPINDSILSKDQVELIASPITSSVNGQDKNDTTFYKSLDSSIATSGAPEESTLYQSASGSGGQDDSTVTESKEEKLEATTEKETEEEDDEHPHLKNVYANAEDEEPEVSEQEDDEETYIVNTTPRNEAIFLTISANFLRERDTLTQHTKTKWSLKILESCDRMRSNTLRINFDTIKVDKKERIYTITDGLCQELEKKLRDILSQRDLTEMNQTIYRCVNCKCQFSMENKYKTRTPDVRCPDCRSTFVAEVHEISKSLDKLATEKLSPAAVVEELPWAMTPLRVQQNDNIVDNDSNSIGSANSLNESSSCSKITNSQSSFDSNQSVVGSSNTERDLEFNGESSDVDIISNPSQSSIEVLDHNASRKTSEERRIVHIPQLETIDDHSFKQSYMESVFGPLNNKPQTGGDAPPQDTQKPKGASGALAHFNLTESSSSGSVTDSVCTAYEQTGGKETAGQEEQLTSKSALDKIVTQNMLASEAQVKDKENTSAAMKKEDSGLSSKLGALLQSTNILMSSSKKFIDAEAAPKVEPSLCQPYKFNYSNFNDIDHRLKLYFYQSKFKEEGEHFKWLVRGRIYNENTQSLCEGLVVMSTCTIYVMEAFAPAHDDVTKWLRQLASATVNRLECIQLLPWKLGLAFTLKDWGSFLLLLQDILRTDSLMLYFANNSLPPECEIQYQPALQISKRLNDAVGDEKLKMCALLNSCLITCGPAKRQLNNCTLLTTDARLCLSTSKLNWLTNNGESDIEICVTQLMSNLVEVEQTASNIWMIHFLDETQDQSEVWQCTFETQENAESCLNAIGQSWEQLFGVPLLNA